MAVTRQDRDALLQQAVARHRAGDAGGALTLYLQCINDNADHPVALNLGGVAAFQTGDPARAVAMLRHAGRLMPDNPDPHFNLGIVFGALGDAAEAEAAYRAAVRIAPAHARAWNNLGGVLCSQGRIEDAVAAYRQAVAAQATYIGAWNNLGETLAGLGRVHEALDAYHRAIAQNPRAADTHNGIGLVYKEHGLLDDAVAAYRKAIECAPKFADAHNNLGNALRALGRVAEAEAAFERAIALDPRFVEAHFNLGMLRFREDDLIPAETSLERAVALDPDFQFGRFFLGSFKALAGDRTAADAHFARLKRDADGYSYLEDSWRYVEAHRGPNTRLFARAVDTLRHGLREAKIDGSVLEFGVRTGSSIRLIASHVDGPVDGFDSFEGLPEAWGNRAPGAYTTAGKLPTVPANVRLHVGWFEDTLPGYCAEDTRPVRFMNIDCDIYSSTATIFRHLAKRIVPGTVIVFDEYLMNKTWREDEYKAFQEAVGEYGWRYEYIAFSLLTQQAAVRIL